MKYLLLIFALLSSLASADQESRVYQIREAGIGILRVQIKDMGDPADQPLRMSVSIYCEDHRRIKNVVQPTWEDLIKSQPICYFLSVEHDALSRSAILHYSTSEFTLGQARCDGHWRRKLDLALLCSAWRN